MRPSIPSLICKLLAAAIAAMLLFEGPASAAEPLLPQPVPGPRSLSPAGGPAEKNPTVPGCAVMGKPKMADYLEGRACPPPGFPYQPEIIDVPGGVRLADPQGACTSGSLPEFSADYDFRAACRTHDYGYDLLRYLELSGGRRRAVDLAFLRDMQLDCVDRVEEAKEHCLTAASLAYRAINTSSRIRSYSTPWGSLQA
jgi:hypothetical protein